MDFLQEITQDIFPIGGAVLTALLWFSFLKKTDVFEAESELNLILAFIIGFLTPTLALWIYYAFEVLGFNTNGEPFNDLAFSIFGIGLIEELSKIFGVLLVIKLLKKQINEPIDYLIFTSVTALGFAVRENYIYFHNYGTELITGRALYSSLIHIINATICVYGIYCYKLFKKGRPILNTIAAILAAVFSHGLFDFFLINNVLGTCSTYVSLIIYLIGINFWTQMINNALNFSPFFTTNFIKPSSQIFYTIIFWFIILYLYKSFFVFYFNDIQTLGIAIVKDIITDGLFILIMALRVSRISLNQNEYNLIRIQIPIKWARNKDEDLKLFWLFPLKIRGENQQEFNFIRYINKPFHIKPIIQETSILPNRVQISIIKKVKFKYEAIGYIVVLNQFIFNKDQKFLLLPNLASLNTKTPTATLKFYTKERLEHKTSTIITLSRPQKFIKKIMGIIYYFLNIDKHPSVKDFPTVCEVYIE